VHAGVVDEPEDETQVVVKRRCNTTCEPDWHYYKCNCYRLIVHEEGITQAQGRQECQSMGSDLASIHSAEENEHVAALSK